MLIRIIVQYLESHRRLVIPQMGAFIVKEPGSSVLFSELLKRDDGVLLSLLVAEGVGETVAAGEIDRFVSEVRHAVQEGREFPLEGLGVLKAGPNATISFVYAPRTGQAGSAPRTPASSVPASSGGGFRASAPAAASPVSAPAGQTGNRLERPATAPEGAAAQRPAAALRSSAAEPGVQSRKTGTTVRDLYGGDTRSAEQAQGAQSGQPMQSARPSAPAQPGADSLQSSQPSRFQLASKKLKRDELFADSYYGRLPRRPAIEQTVTVKRRSDHFIWIALIAAGIALAAILFGQWCDSFNREGEEIYLEQPADLLPDEMPQY